MMQSMNKWTAITLVGIAVLFGAVLIPSYVAEGPTTTQTKSDPEIVSSTTLSSEVDTEEFTPFVRIGEHEFVVEVADTRELRSLGLSGHAPLEPMGGMLFLFPKPDKQTFWMKDMLFSIDMVWIDEAGRVVHIESDVSPETYPKTFSAAEDALYVLEVAAGTMNNLGIGVGDIAEILLEQ